MIAIVVDEMKPSLEILETAISNSPDIVKVVSFSCCRGALGWLKNNMADLAFVETNMKNMPGIELARKIQEACPGCRIVFCTESPQYALEAFGIHASGYLLKPITQEMVQREIDYIKTVAFSAEQYMAEDALLEVKCFGYFDVFREGKPLSFRRSKTKELFAYLVDRNGAGVTTRQICAALWENSEDDAKSKNHLYQVINDFKRLLSENGCSELLVKTSSTYAIDVKKVKCDYYDYVKIGRPRFQGEYMTQYSWAENTLAILSHKNTKN